LKKPLKSLGEVSRRLASPAAAHLEGDLPHRGTSVRVRDADGLEHLSPTGALTDGSPDGFGFGHLAIEAINQDHPAPAVAGHVSSAGLP
jgi:hypothetical protein